MSDQEQRDTSGRNEALEQDIVIASEFVPGTERQRTNEEIVHALCKLRGWA